MLLSRLASLLLLLAICCPTFAQNPPRSITVVGSAEKGIAPDVFYLKVLVKGQGKTMALARDDFRRQQENVRTVFNEMDFPELAMESRGRTISDSAPDPEQMQMMMIEGDNGADTEKTFSITEQFDFKWQVAPQTPQSDTETGITNLVDRIIAEKLNFTSRQQANYYAAWEPNLVTGRCSKMQAEERSLRAAAMENAKAQAAELAALAGAKLGRVLEVEVARESLDYSTIEQPGLGISDPSSCKLGQQIDLKAVLKVKFELE